MSPPTPNAAIITGHPPHGLRVFRFLELYKPVAYMISDGSGSTGRSKSTEAARFIETAGARPSPVFCRFTDAEMYDIIKKGDTETLLCLVDEIVLDLEKNSVELVVGDAVEGFNPTHDLCRYLINSVVKLYEQRSGRAIANFDFLLDGPPDHCPADDASDAIWLRLDEQDLARKMAAVKEYPDIAVDIEQAITQYGEASFATECLRPVKDTSRIRVWESEHPHYESYGAQKVKEGVYSDLISFEHHMEPLARYLNDYAGAPHAR